jgi:hypothetical protein
MEKKRNLSGVLNVVVLGVYIIYSYNSYFNNNLIITITDFHYPLSK